MKLFGRELTGYPQVLVTLSVVLLIATGLCGLQSVFGVYPMRDGGFWIIPGVLEFLASLISALAIIATLLAWLTSFLRSRISRR
jgi:hypothetical protein